jgi:hypothetical protein
MTNDRLTCEQVDAADFDTRYLAGTLSDAEAESFEAHFMECERCWALVKGGADVRAAFAVPTTAATTQAGALVGSGAARTKARMRWSGPRWIGLAAATLLAAFGLRQWLSRTSGPPSSADSTVLRGSTDALAITTGATPRGLEVVWRRHAGAASYRARLYTASGTVVLEREVVDTAIAVTWSELGGARADSLYWQVQPLDHLRVPLGSSPLTPAPARPPGAP